MQDIRIFRSVLSVGRARTFPHSSKSDGDEYDSDELNDTGVFNNSSLTIVKTSQLVEPPGWYLGRLYYVVTRGSSVGVFHRL